MQLTADKQFLDQIQGIRDRVFRVAKRILISKEEAEDATQEVILNCGIWRRVNASHLTTWKPIP